MSAVGQDEAPQADRKDMLRDAFDAVESNNISSEPVKAQENVSRETAAEKTERLRDEAGRFAATDGKSQAKEKGASVAQAAPAETVPPVQAVEPPLWERPPASWKKEYHPLWSSADPKLREYAYQREEQMRAGVEPLLPKAQLADAITRVSEPYMQTIRGMGIDLPTAVEGLMKADHTLRHAPPDQKLAYFMQLGRQYGINLNGADVDGQAPQPQVDPNYSIMQELNRLRGEFTTLTQRQEQERDAVFQADINKFAQKAEYFDEVRPAMIQLLQSGMAESLEDAYEKAIRLDTQLFESIQSAKHAETEAQKRASADAAAKSARRAAVSVRSATPGSTTSTKAQDRRSMLLEQFDGVAERL